MARTVLEVVMAADPRSLERGFQRGTKAADKFGKDVDKSTKRVSVGLAGIGSAVKVAGGAFAAAGLVSAVKDLAKASADSEASSARMQSQLKASGISYRAHAKEIDGVIQKTSKLAALDDEDLQDAFTNIVRATGSVSQGLKGVGLAADIATAKHIDVAKAGVLVGKVANGNVSALARYGIQIDKNATSSQALAALQQKFGGQAKAFGETSAGAYARFGVATENLKETLGGALAPALSASANALSKFMDQLQTGAGVGGKVTTAYNGVRVAVQSVVSSISVFVKQNQATFRAMAQSFASIGKVIGSVFEGFVLPALRRALPGIKKQIEGLVTVIRGVAEVIDGIIHGDFSKIFGGLKTIVSGAIHGMLGQIQANTALIREAAAQLGGAILKPIKSAVSNAASAVSGIGHNIANGVRSQLDDLNSFFVRLGKGFLNAIVRGIKSAPGAIGNAVKGAAKGAVGLLGIGDGIGRRMSVGRPAPGGASGSLMGADSRLAPIAALGRADGLTVTSGRRVAGGRTSSGGISYHGSGEAIDQAGSPAAMMKFFRDAKSRYGSRLAELIYTPAGVGIKDGKPFRYTGAVAADHYDHVHAALDLGAPGPGIGGARSGPRTGDGIGRHDYSLGDYKTLWQRAGGSPAAAALAAAVGMAEGGGHANASNRNSDGSIDRGLWQINSVHGALSTFDALGNARAAVKISAGGRNWNPWVAYTTGAYRKFLSAARGAAAGSAAGGRSGGSSSSGAGGFGAMTPAGRGTFNAPGTMGAIGARVGAPGFGDGSNGFQSLYAPYQAVRDSKQQAFASIAGTTSGLGDDVQAMQMLVSNARQTYGEMVKEFGQGSAEAATALASIVGAEKQLAETAHEAWLKPFRDGITDLNDELVRAQVDTPGDKTDDIAVVTRQLAAATAGYEDAIRRGDDPNAVIEFGQQITSLRGDLSSLQSAVSENTSALDGIAVEMKRANDLATSQVGVQNSQLVKSLADLLSGQIVGKGLQPRSQTAGAGRVMSY